LRKKTILLLAKKEEYSYLFIGGEGRSKEKKGEKSQWKGGSGAFSADAG